MTGWQPEDCRGWSKADCLTLLKEWATLRSIMVRRDHYVIRCGSESRPSQAGPTFPARCSHGKRRLSSGSRRQAHPARNERGLDLRDSSNCAGRQRGG